MRPSLRILNAHKPLINFIGKRSWPSSSRLSFFLLDFPSSHPRFVVEPETQRPHPAAPSELQRSFSDFLKKFEASATSSSKKRGTNGSKQTFGEFWEAPARFWRPRVRELEDGEIDAVLSGGASLR